MQISDGDGDLSARVAYLCMADAGTGRTRRRPPIRNDTTWHDIKCRKCPT